MKLKVIAVGKKMPQWVTDGVNEYAKRLPRDFDVTFVEVPLAKRSKSVSVAQCVQKESDTMVAQIKSGDYVVALDERGRSFTTLKMSEKLSQIADQGSTIAFLLGGPDGLGDECFNRANEKWSLSCLTLPHPLVRVLLTEQLYRVWSLLSGHPYHRE